MTLLFNLSLLLILQIIHVTATATANTIANNIYNNNDAAADTTKTCRLLPPSLSRERRIKDILNVLPLRGGGGDDERKNQFIESLKKAQIEASEVFGDDAGVLSPMIRLLGNDDSTAPLPDLLSICTMASIHESKIMENQENAKEIYDQLRKEYVNELNDQLNDAGIEMDTNAVDGNKAMIDHCIELLGSDYLNMSFFQVENFRQKVLKNPFWKGLIKASLITHLGDDSDCPKFDEEFFQDGTIFGETLAKC